MDADIDFVGIHLRDRLDQVRDENADMGRIGLG